MTLHVTDNEVRLAQKGQLTAEQFINIIRRSLPYFWARVEQLAASLNSGAQVAYDDVTPINDEQHMQLLQGAASDAIRHATQEYFGIVLAFRSSHCLAAADRSSQATLASFISMYGQVCCQRPALLD